MKFRISSIVLILAIKVVTFSCREPFDPVIPANQSELLVVEGYINTGGGVTTIKLSRSTPINVAQREAFELNARVSIESDAGVFYDLQEADKGIYNSDYISLDATSKYRLIIKTKDNREYRSEFVQSQVTPAIDDVHWETDKGIQVYVDTHDEANKTWYYQWEYEEIWEIRSPYQSKIKYENGNIVPRPEIEQTDMMFCWRFEKSPDLILGSSEKFVSDDINNFHLRTIPKSSEILGYKYSMLVRQHALSKVHYRYLQLIRKNTDAVGSLFDPQPSELNGNLFCVSDPEEQVIGYLGAYTTEEKRIFIENSELRDWGFDKEMACWKKAAIVPNDPKIMAQMYKLNIPADYVYNDEIPAKIVGALAYSPICVDCRTRGGNKIPKPVFW